MMAKIKEACSSPDRSDSFKQTIKDRLTQISRRIMSLSMRDAAILFVIMDRDHNLIAMASQPTAN
ncbi:hypothetical protein CBM2623_B30101 [Cupriavidus taiwanensis]|nr:hypothetical protein CBM2608_B30100 [Cupriavidus taiwanensis]SPA34454.1 hypothetical protein CBM2623_B30101 [Cupriavidus taiwanensis]